LGYFNYSGSSADRRLSRTTALISGDARQIIQNHRACRRTVTFEDWNIVVLAFSGNLQVF
jgi:hypothetical protein